MTVSIALAAMPLWDRCDATFIGLGGVRAFEVPFSLPSFRKQGGALIMPTYELRWKGTLANSIAAAIGKTCRDNTPPKDQLLHTVDALVTVIANTALLYPSMTKPEEQRVCVDLVAARLKAFLARGRWTRLASKAADDPQRQSRLMRPAA